MALGVPFEFKTGAWSGLLPSVIAGQSDVMWSNLYYTPTRAEQVDFVTDRLAATRGLVHKGNPKNIHALEDTCGTRAAAGLGTVEEAMFRKVSDQCVAAGKQPLQVVTYPDRPSGLRMVQNDRADVMMGDAGSLAFFIKQYPDELESGYMILTDYNVGPGISKSMPELRQAIFDADFADQRQRRQQFQQAGDIIGGEAPSPVGRKSHHVTLAERMVQRPRHIVGQALRPHVVIDGVLAATSFEILAHLAGAVLQLIGWTADIFGSLPHIVADPVDRSVVHSVGPHEAGAQPLRMVDQDMQRRALEGNARTLNALTQLGEDIVDEALIARLVHQPVHDIVVSSGGGEMGRCVHGWLPGVTGGRGYVVSR